MDDPPPPPKYHKHQQHQNQKLNLNPSSSSGESIRAAAFTTLAEDVFANNDNSQGHDYVDKDNNDDNDKKESNKKHHNSNLFQKLSASANILKEVLPIQRSTLNNNHNSHNRNATTATGIHSKISTFSVDNGNGTGCNNANPNLYYKDNYNNLSWKCSFGTNESDGIWMNTSDVSGIIMSGSVWVMICKL